VFGNFVITLITDLSRISLSCLGSLVFLFPKTIWLFGFSCFQRLFGSLAFLVSKDYLVVWFFLFPKTIWLFGFSCFQKLFGSLAFLVSKDYLVVWLFLFPKIIW
jgi:hypothetical protein